VITAPPDLAFKYATFVGAVVAFTVVSRIVHREWMRCWTRQGVSSPPRVEAAILLMFAQYGLLIALAGIPNWWFFIPNGHVAQIGIPHAGVFAVSIGFACYLVWRARSSRAHRWLAAAALLTPPYLIGCLFATFWLAN
jgi:hypothetical protein